MHSGTLTLSIDSRLDYVFMVGLSVRAICAAVPLTESETEALELCVVEAVNNAIEHAYGGSPGHPVEIELTLDRAAACIVVRDRGRSMDWAAACARADRYAADHLSEGGRGLLIMRSLMDVVSYRSGGGCNALRMVKRRQKRRDRRRTTAQVGLRGGDGGRRRAEMRRRAARRPTNASAPPRHRSSVR